MTIPTYVVIPYRNKAEMTAHLASCLVGATVVFLLDNGSQEDIVPFLKTSPEVRILRCPDMTITQMWNHGWTTALEWSDDKPANLAILNNDITVPYGFLHHLEEALRSDEKWWCVTPDTHRRVREGLALGGIRQVSGIGVGQMAGWAFMVKAEARLMGLPPIDEQFEWWYGDNELAVSIEEHGGQIGLVEGLPCDHTISATWRDHPELHPQVHVDAARYFAKRGYK